MLATVFMESQWNSLRSDAVTYRKRGLSIRTIEKKLGISRSTLSGWFKNIELSPLKRKELIKRRDNALKNAREKAVLWHQKQKEGRIMEARQEALKTLGQIDINNPVVQEIVLAILYFAEGRKIAAETSLGSSDPLMVKFFLEMLKKLYSIDIGKIDCSLHLRADQNIDEVKRFWAKELDLPINKFKNFYKDKRTVGSNTRSNYKGVCNIRYGSVAIKRKLLFLSRMFCENLIGAVSSVG